MAAAATSSGWGSDSTNKTNDETLNELYIALFTNTYSSVALGGEPNRTRDQESTETQRAYSIRTLSSIEQHSRADRILSCLKTNAVQLEKIPDTSVWRPTRQNQEFLDQQSNAFQRSNKGAMGFPLVIDIPTTVFFFTNIREPTGYLSQEGNTYRFLLSPNEKPFTRGEVIDTLKIVYGYCTGGLMINAKGDILNSRERRQP